MNRRGFLGFSAAALLTACSGGGNDKGRAPGTTSVPKSTTTLPPVPSLASDPFTLGVASGDPAADGFVLWTRLAPDPMVPGGGMPAGVAPVRWMVGTDDALRDIAAEGAIVTNADVGYSVHAVVEGLDADRPYWYRFAIGDYETPIARTRTFPAADASPSRLRFGFASCQNYRDGYWSAWGDLAGEDLDLVVFLGDYIYESGLEGAVRAHDIPEVLTLDDYRSRYALYRSDPLLRAAHNVAPWLITWDDHEVDNNYQGIAPEPTSATPDPAQFLERKAAAYRAWWEHMPTRVAAPTGPELKIYNTTDFGDLARFYLLDTRQYRTDEPCLASADIGAVCEAALAPAVTVLGAEQEAWLDGALADSNATWDVLAQQIVFARLAFTSPGPDGIFNLDQWDGYPAARRRVLSSLVDNDLRNAIVLTGDIHASGVSDVTADFDDPNATVLGAEFVGTSISSGAPAALEAVTGLAIANNPHVHHADATKRGWVLCEVTPEQWRAEFRLVDDALVENSPVTPGTAWVVESGGQVQPA
jgi:alkaline phosphatase D